MTITPDQRRTIVAWWITYRLTKCWYSNNSDTIYSIIEEAEENLEKRDAALAREYEEYIPQF